MEDSDRDRLALEALLGEIGRLRQNVKEWYFPQEQFFGFSIVVLGGVLTLGITTKDAILLAVAPAIFFIIYAHMLQVNVEMLSRAGHLRCLEEVANRQLGRMIFLDEIYVGPSRQGKTRFGRSGVMLFQISMGILLLLVTLIGGVAVARVAEWAPLVYWIGVAFAVAMLVISVREVSHAYSRGYLSALNAQPFSQSEIAHPPSPLAPSQMLATEQPNNQIGVSRDPSLTE